MIDTVGVLKETKKDSWGIVVAAEEPVSVKCRVMYSLKFDELRSVTGSSITPTAKIFFEGVFDIGFGDKIIFTDDYGNERAMDIHEIKPIKDFSGNVLFTRVVV